MRGGVAFLALSHLLGDEVLGRTDAEPEVLWAVLARKIRKVISNGNNKSKMCVAGL